MDNIWCRIGVSTNDERHKTIMNTSTVNPAQKLREAHDKFSQATTIYEKKAAQLEIQHWTLRNRNIVNEYVNSLNKSVMTPRQEHANNLAHIQELTGDKYYRKMTFVEADRFIRTYEAYRDEGYPRDTAIEYAWDEYWALRLGPSRAYQRGIWR